jgi:DNA-binding IclR family transcriptional regulator
MIQMSNRFDSNPTGFTFFTNHVHVLLLIAREAGLRMRELAAEVGITERAVQRIVEDLTAAGYLVVTKEGRRNRYQVARQMPLRHRVEAHRTVGELIDFVFPEAESEKTAVAG